VIIQRSVNIARKIKQKCFLFFLKEVPEKGLGTKHIHTFKENKKTLLTSIIV
jgi:hypothetical protein